LEEAWESVSTDAAAVLGLRARAVQEGAPAELLAVRAGSWAEAVADASEHRTVIHRGLVVASTDVQRQPIRNWPDM
jgi:cytosine deaminase